MACPHCRSEPIVFTGRCTQKKMFYLIDIKDKNNSIEKINKELDKLIR